MVTVRLLNGEQIDFAGDCGYAVTADTITVYDANGKELQAFPKKETRGVSQFPEPSE